MVTPAHNPFATHTHSRFSSPCIWCLLSPTPVPLKETKLEDAKMRKRWGQRDEKKTEVLFIPNPLWGPWASESSAVTDWPWFPGSALRAELHQEPSKLPVGTGHPLSRLSSSDHSGLRHLLLMCTMAEARLQKIRMRFKKSGLWKMFFFFF